MGKESSFNKWSKITGIHMQKNEFGHQPHNIHKNYLKMDQRPKCQN